MKGIDKICEKIIKQAQEECTIITERANAESAEILKEYGELAGLEVMKISEHGQKTASEHEERLTGAAKLKAQKLILKTKQELIDTAFNRSLGSLPLLPEENYISTLAKLAAECSISGDEEIILSPSDRKAYGKQITNRANRILKTLKEDTSSRFARLTRSGKGLTLSDSTRDISGGVILLKDNMETNATFDTLIRLLREKLSGEVADILFN